MSWFVLQRLDVADKQRGHEERGWKNKKQSVYARVNCFNRTSALYHKDDNCATGDLRTLLLRSKSKMPLNIRPELGQQVRHHIVPQTHPVARQPGGSGPSVRIIDRCQSGYARISNDLGVIKARAAIIFRATKMRSAAFDARCQTDPVPKRKKRGSSCHKVGNTASVTYAPMT